METYFNHTESGKTDEQMLDVVTADEARHSPPLCGSNGTELRSVGQVEISDEATLEDLKTQVELIIFLIPKDPFFFFCPGPEVRSHICMYM